MADSKITALASIGTGTDPANDPLVIVDVSDVSPGGMSATGTTKKVTLNNLLACSPTATLASATITGDLTVRTNRLIVNSNGAGIGTTPSAWGVGTRGLELANGSVISFAGYIGTVGTANSYYNGSNWIYTTTAGAARYDQDNGSHIWFNAPSGTAGNTVGWSTAMTLNSTGLLVGTTNNFASSRLCVQGTAGTSTPDVTIGIPVNSGGNTGLAIGRSASTNGYIFLDAYKAAVGGTELVLNSINGGSVLIGLSTVVAAGGCLQLKSGITFPATQVASSDANTLDDYEEGTWTIGLTFGGGSTGMTTATNIGRYTKIGRQVTVSGNLSLSNKGSSTGIAEIQGLPFTIANANEAYSAANVRFNGVSFADIPISIGAIGSTKILLQEITKAGVVTDITDADFTNTSSCIIGFTYFV